MFPNKLCFICQQAESPWMAHVSKHQVNKPVGDEINELHILVLLQTAQ